MCDPVIAGGAMLAMSGIQAYTQYQQGKYASKVAEANADIATAQANDAINRGNAEAEQRRRETRQRLGTQAATMGATGADLSTGNALDIFGDTAQFGALDSLTTVNNAQREAYGYQVQAANYKAEASAASISTGEKFGAFVDSPRELINLPTPPNATPRTASIAIACRSNTSYWLAISL